MFIGKEEGIYNETLRTGFVIVACLDPDNPVSSLKIDNHILQYLIQVDGTVEKLLEDKEKTLDEIFDRIIEINFIGY